MKKLLNLLSVLFIISIGFVNLSAQDELKTDASQKSNEIYKIYTYTVMASNNSTVNKKMPDEVSRALDDIKKDFAYKDYQLLSTQFQLIKESGDVLYRSVLNNLDEVSDKNYPVFGDWSYQGLTENMINGRKQLGFKTFRFNMRFPVKTPTKDDASVVTYDSIGITTRNIDFPVGKSIVIASFPIEISDKTLFFVIRTESVK